MQSTMTTLRWCALVLLSGLAIDSRLAANPPEGFEGTFRLGEASAPPGGEARVPFYIRSNPDLQAFAFSIDFDEEMLEAGLEMEHVFYLPNADPWEFAVFHADNANATPGNAGIDEGFLIGAVIFSFTEYVSLPVDVDNEVVAYSFSVKPDAPLGTTEIRFLDGGLFPGEEYHVENYMTLAGLGVVPDTKITPIFVQSRFQIVPDISIFIRGDSNDDGKVDLADAQATLGYLFQAAEPLRCLDAADANDDGKLNVSDPVTILQVLFLGREALPAPSAARGSDPTPDAIGCGS